MSCSPRTVISTPSPLGIWPPGPGPGCCGGPRLRLGLPIVKVLSDGTYLSVLINPVIRGAQRRKAIMAAAREIAEEGGRQR